LSPPAIGEPLRLLLADLPGRFPPELIDRIWIFAPREIAGRESGLVVLSLRGPEQARDGARRLVTWRYEAVRDRGRVRRTDSVAEQGSAPTERIPRLIEGVLARMGDAAETPIAEAVAGDPGRWDAFLDSLGIAVVDPSKQE
jgi:hypothetical protein